MTKKLLTSIIYSEKKMGSLRSDISEIIDQNFGKEKRDKHWAEVTYFWQYLRSFITNILFQVNGTFIRIYNDGIPIRDYVGGKLIGIGSQKGISNHQIVLLIIWRGVL